MPYRFRIAAGSTDVLNEFLRNDLPGVSIFHEPKHTSVRRPPPKMAYDSAEDILQFIVSVAHDIDINLFAYWLVTRIENQTRGRKTTINGHPIPSGQAELAALIRDIIKKSEQQKPSKIETVPSGYPAYSAKDFEERFEVTPEQSSQIAKDYLSLVQFDEEGEFGKSVFKAGRDLHSLAQAVMARYKLEKKPAAAVSLFFANVSTARNAQVRKQELGISKCVWVASTCGLRKEDRNASHALLSGQQFDPATGLRTDDGYLLPGVVIDCTCIGKSIIPGFDG